VRLESLEAEYQDRRHCVQFDLFGCLNMGLALVAVPRVVLLELLSLSKVLKTVFDALRSFGLGLDMLIFFPGMMLKAQELRSYVLHARS
jgi:hypothetical protein